MIKLLPPLLVASRFLIAFYLLWDSRDRKISKLFLPLFCFAFFSDFLDGFICRTFGGGSTLLTLWDGYADSLLYLSAFLSLCRVQPELVKKFTGLLLFLLCLQIFSWGFSLVKFGRITSYHTYAVKFWGILMLLSLIESFITKRGVLLVGMVIIGSLCLIEDIAITTVMPYWKGSIKNVAEAVSLSNAHRSRHASVK